MRIVVHVLLAAIFAMPVAVIVYAARWLIDAVAGGVAQSRAGAAGRGDRAGAAVSRRADDRDAGRDDRAGAGCSADASAARRVAHARAGDAVALAVLIGGVIVVRRRCTSASRTGRARIRAARASTWIPRRPQPASRRACRSDRSDRVADGARARRRVDRVRLRSLEKLLDGYYLLDRNYNYHFHNELFVRTTPLLPELSCRGSGVDRRGRPQARSADDAAAANVATRRRRPVAGALLADVRAYVALQLRSRRDARAHERGVRDDARPACSTRPTSTRARASISACSSPRCSTSIAPCCHRAGGVARLSREFVTTAAPSKRKYANRIVGF